MRVGDDSFDVALVIPLQGPAGIFGPSCEACAELAAEEVNRDGGVLGRQVRLRGGRRRRGPRRVAATVDALVTSGAVAAVTGWHISAVRQAIAPRVAGRVPYVYTPLYEGGERTPGVFLVGETPSQQLLPSMRWMATELGVRRGASSATTTSGRGDRRLPPVGTPAQRGRDLRRGVRPPRHRAVRRGAAPGRAQRRRGGADAAGGRRRGPVQPGVRRAPASTSRCCG